MKSHFGLTLTKMSFMLLPLLSVALCVLPAAGFVTRQAVTSMPSLSILQSTSRSRQEEQEQFYDIDLEKLLAAGTDHLQDHGHANNNGFLLTSHVERIKEMELNLLQCLEESDEAIDAIVDLWTKEREDASLQLQQMERHCSPGLEKEEAQLYDMIDEYGLEWVEPMIRLSLLLFTKGRYEEATVWCQEALMAKPWHFEAGQLLVALYLRQEDFPAALQAARQFTLPNLSHTNKRRKSWVRRQVSSAQAWLDQARQMTQQAVHDDILDECPVGDDNCWA